MKSKLSMFGDVAGILALPIVIITFFLLPEIRDSFSQPWIVAVISLLTISFPYAAMGLLLLMLYLAQKSSQSHNRLRRYVDPFGLVLVLFYLYIYLPFISESSFKVLVLFPYSFLLLICVIAQRIVEIEKLRRRFGPDFFSNVFRIKGTSYIGTEIQHVSSVDDRGQDTSVMEHMQHIMYKIINDSIFSLDEIVKYKLDEATKYPRNLEESFDFAMETFRKLNNKQGSFAWFINLVDPEIWLNDVKWRTKYVIPMLHAAHHMVQVDIRRIHVIKDSDYTNTEFHKKLMQILLKEQLIGIDNKVLKIKGDILHTDPHGIGVLLGNVFLLDYAIMYSRRDSYLGTVGPDGEIIEAKEVQCSDIYPYFFGSQPKRNQVEDKRKIYVLKDFHSFSLFKEHFSFFWHLEEYLRYCSPGDNVGIHAAFGSLAFLKKIEAEKSVEVKNFFDLIKDFTIDYDVIDWKDIAEFVAEYKVRPNQNKDPISQKLVAKLKNSFSKLQKDTEGINRQTFNNNFQEIQINPVKSLPYIY